jgi:hypothetical protein
MAAFATSVQKISPIYGGKTAPIPQKILLKNLKNE